MKVSPLLKKRLDSLKPGEEIQVIIILFEPVDAARVHSDIESTKATLLSPPEETSPLKVVSGGKESLLAFEDFPWLDLMFEDQSVVPIE